MHELAKLFQTGGSQAVRLPKEFRFEGQEAVRISRQGHRVILEPVHRNWSPEFLEMIATPCDFPYVDQPPPLGPGPDFDSE